MSNSVPIIINERNLSYAWCRAFLHIIDNPGKEISPLIISLTGFNQGIPNEDSSIRDALDNCLKDNKEQSIHTVANTIFPSSLWRKSKYDREKFFDIYIDTLPRIKALAKSKNRRGLYFERLISFGCGPHNGNQLEHIIFEYKSDPTIRRSMFQASIFDPGRDHVPNSRQLGFPCLQHISIVPNNKDKTLVLNSFYATQQLFDKAYGNYLGLCRLGNFMAQEMGLIFDRMNCFIGVEKLDTIGKRSSTLVPVIDASRNTANKWQIEE
ncbi:hypothetical protein VB638_16045 [Dolichospermum sp. UHCC 0684]|uniref:thymidylate synthase n=1 Tax=unclassified Dolichospermum TaxID=2622029 RepID=UPI0014480EEF|nr:MULTISPECIES: thymidylate synthase [unclassified Dolichospermum]MEA5531060.1 hypothetical protein [Dolichospermum sp. UHCC 0684]MTJ35783.1 thymidylate synthase [Dolichospermum sp. UHCC 0260]